MAKRLSKRTSNKEQIKKEVIENDPNYEYKTIASYNHNYEDYIIINTYSSIDLARSHYTEDIMNCKKINFGIGNFGIIKAKKENEDSQ